MQKLAELCIKRPVFATMLIMALVVSGMFSYFKLGVDLFPKVEFPIVSCTITLRGASPEEVETQVTKRVEEAVNTTGLPIREDRNQRHAGGTRDDLASRIMCAVLDELHAPRHHQLPDLVPPAPRSAVRAIDAAGDRAAPKVIDAVLGADRRLQCR